MSPQKPLKLGYSILTCPRISELTKLASKVSFTGVTLLIRFLVQLMADEVAKGPGARGLSGKWKWCVMEHWDALTIALLFELKQG